MVRGDVPTTKVNPGEIDLTAATAVPFATRASLSQGQVPESIPLPPLFLERFALTRVLGYGGIGIVVAAHDLEHGRPVAIKFLTRQGDMHELRRFLREGRLLRKLRHPNLLPVYEADQQSGHPYLVMPLVSGGTVRGLMKSGPLALDAALPPVLDVLEALSACHLDGIVHRDVKPENILLDATGRALLADLGIAKVSERSATETQTGMILGTPRYMAPEQASAERVGPATDIYSVATILYEMLAGRLPFEASGIAEYYAALLEQPPPPLLSVAPGVPAGVAGLVDQSLAKDPASRPGSAAALADALRTAAGLPVPKRRRRGVTRRVRAVRLDAASLVPALIAAVGLTLVAMLLIGRRPAVTAPGLGPAPADPPVVASATPRTPAPSGPVRQETGAGLALAPRQVLSVQGFDDEPPVWAFDRLAVMQLVGGTARSWEIETARERWVMSSLPSPSVLTPWGAVIIDDRQIEVRRFPDGSLPGIFQLGPGKKRLAGNGRFVYWVSPNGTLELFDIVHGEQSSFATALDDVAFSSNGHWIAGFLDDELRVFDRVASTMNWMRRLERTFKGNRQLFVADDGVSCVCVGRRARERFDPWGLAVDTEVVRWTRAGQQAVSRTPCNGVLSVDGTASWLATAGEPGRLVRITNLVTSAGMTLPATGELSQVAFSLDGQHLATVEVSGNLKVWKLPVP